jgi:hypothetical protein
MEDRAVAGRAIAPLAEELDEALDHGSIDRGSVPTVTWQEVLGGAWSSWAAGKGHVEALALIPKR